MSFILLTPFFAACASGVVLHNSPTSESATKEDYKKLRFVPAIDPYEDDPTFQNETEIDWRILPKDISRDPEAAWMPLKGPKGGPFWHDRLLVWPEKQFAFCYIEKNACTQFNHLMNVLNGLGIVSLPWWKSAWNHFFVGYHSFESISTSAGWKLATFTRDPAERFLSAWASKCVDWEDQGVNCIGSERLTEENETVKVDAFEEMVLNKSREYEELRHRDGWWNAHYDPQSTFCGLEASNYTFIGRLSGNFTDVHNQVYHMLTNVAGAPADHAVYPALNRLFPKERIEGHHTDSAKRMEAYYRKPEIYNIVADIFAADYEQFNFQRGTYLRRYV